MSRVSSLAGVCTEDSPSSAWPGPCHGARGVPGAGWWGSPCRYLGRAVPSVPGTSGVDGDRPQGLAVPSAPDRPASGVSEGRLRCCACLCPRLCFTGVLCVTHSGFQPLSLLCWWLVPCEAPWSPVRRRGPLPPAALCPHFTGVGTPASPFALQTNLLPLRVIVSPVHWAPSFPEPPSPPTHSVDAQAHVAPPVPQPGTSRPSRTGRSEGSEWLSPPRPRGAVQGSPPAVYQCSSARTPRPFPSGGRWAKAAGPAGTLCGPVSVCALHALPVGTVRPQAPHGTVPFLFPLRRSELPSP